MIPNIKVLRNSKGLTQQQVANAIGCTQTRYSHYERGTREIPTAILIALADFYSVSLDTLIGRTFPKTVNKDDIT